MAETFNDVVKALNENNVEQKSTTNAIEVLNNTLQKQFKLASRNQKDDEEDRRESKKAGRESKSSSNGNGLMSKFKDGAGFGAGFGIAGMLGRMAGAAGKLLKPIVLAGRLLLGPVGLTLMAAYVLFRNIGENKNFKATLTTLQETWTKLKTTFSDIISVFKGAGESEGVASLIESVKNFIPNFITQVQDIILDVVSTLAESIFGVLDTFKLLIQGDFKGAFDSIWNVISGIGDFIVRTVENIVQIFLPTAEDGFISDKFFAVLDIITNTFENVKNKIKEGIAFVGDSILGAWDAVTTFFSDESIAAAFNYVKDGIWNGVTGTIEYITDFLWRPINAVITWVSDKFSWNEEDAPQFSILDKLTDWVGRFGEWFGSFLPDIGQIARDMTEKLLSFLPDWMVKSMIRMQGGNPDLFTVKDGAISKKIVDEQRVNPFGELMGSGFKGLGASNYIVDTSTNTGDNISVVKVAPPMIPSMGAVDQRLLNQQYIRSFGFQ